MGSDCSSSYSLHVCYIFESDIQKLSIALCLKGLLSISAVRSSFTCIQEGGYDERPHQFSLRRKIDVLVPPCRFQSRKSNCCLGNPGLYFLPIYHSPQPPISDRQHLRHEYQSTLTEQSFKSIRTLGMMACDSFKQSDALLANGLET